MIQHFAFGVGLGWACGLMVIWYDALGIGSLLASYDSTALTALFFAKGGLYFGTFSMGVAVMNVGKEGSGGAGPNLRLFVERLSDAFRGMNAKRPLVPSRSSGSTQRVFAT